MPPQTAFLLTGLALWAGCPSSPGTEPDFSTEPGTATIFLDSTTTGPPPGTTSSATTPVPATSSTGHDPVTGEDTNAVILDVGPDDLPPQQGCRKADFLFVIDNSGSMAEHQQQLLDSFPGFIDAILGSLDDLDSVHVGVVTSDAYEFNAEGCQQLGALVTQTGGENSSQAICTPFQGGQRFFTEQDSLAAAFNCVGRVGTDGSGNEMPLTAAVQALQTEFVGVGGCNEGFLRPDAILVVVIVSDDPPFPGTPDDAWPLIDATVLRDQIVAAKDGNEEAVVMIGVVSWDDTSCVCPWCCPGYGCMAPNDNAIELVEAFGERGVLASVCSDDYSPVLAETIATIDATCDVFDPQG